MDKIKFEAWKKKVDADTDNQWSLVTTVIPQIWRAYEELEKLNYLLGRLNLDKKKQMAKGLNTLNELTKEFEEVRKTDQFEYAEIIY